MAYKLKPETSLQAGMRKRMVEEIRAKGITDAKVLEAIGTVQRHLFLPEAFDRLAYQDRAMQIQCMQTISQPSTVAFQTQLLDIEHSRTKVLEIGTGSGYQTAILYYLTTNLFTIERQKQLYETARATFDRLNIHPRCFYGDGYEGLENYAPFDRIIVTCGASHVPEKLLSQLKVGGIMVIPVGDREQTMYRITRVSDTEFSSEKYGSFRFVPMLKDRQK